jgi:DNA-binding HxlR family transcriptional regulator
LTALQAKGKAESGTRAGSYALSLLAIPLNVWVLQALLVEPRSLVDLRRAAGSPPQTTLRKHLRALTQLGVISKRRQDSSTLVMYELTSSGRELMDVGNVLRAWLAAAPAGPHELGTIAAKGAIKALVDGWSTSLIRALAARPLSLTELDALISGLSYPSLERRLGAMRMADQVEAAPGRGRGTPYTVTDWLRYAMAPLGVAAAWERRHALAGTLPIGRLDIEAGFLLTVPLLGLPSDVSGLCRMAVEIAGGDGRRLTGVLVDVNEGAVVSCVASLEGKATAWASGPVKSWLRTIIEQDTDRLEVGGDSHLANAILDGLHGVLFGAERSPRIPR